MNRFMAAARAYARSALVNGWVTTCSVGEWTECSGHSSV